MRLKERRQGEADGDGDSSGGEFGCRDDAGDRARGWRDAVRAEGRTERRREVGDTRSPGTLVCSLLSRRPLLSGGRDCSLGCAIRKCGWLSGSAKGQVPGLGGPGQRALLL